MNKNYVNLDVNPCKMCMPMGGSLAFKGIENSMILMHGSQGCSTYIRRHIATHYNEPIDIASTSLSENGTIYGGAKNLKHGIMNVMESYSPKVIGVLTTCLAETIGEDIRGIIEEFKQKKDISCLDIIPVSTPGYGASHFEGYYHTIRNIISFYNEKQAIPNEKINIIVSNITSADIREIKRIIELFQVEYVLIPDTSETLDAPYKENFTKIPDGGTSIEDIKQMSGAKATIELSVLIDDIYSPGKYLEDLHQVPLYQCPIPIGMKNVDSFIKALCTITGREIPVSLVEERGRMLDAIVDSHKYNGEGRAAIYGDPEIVYAVTTLCNENGIKPMIVASGSKSYKIRDLLKLNESVVIPDTDFETIHKYVKELKPNLLIGNSEGKFIKEKEGTDLVRIGFPIHDHIGAQRKLYVGYNGSLRFLDEITNTLLDIKHHGYRERLYNEFYVNKGGNKNAQL
ncbi:nitrogenase [Alkalibaculum sp. M08DMB]|uniref:Nitrogenase n=1 Tax=Alkalibaculum sporogenes TaxID=2655001 RepID=A0A6A7KCG7_9FIRM|nr:nitrogenase component 1 [Alkalibaculum sporogenes]MPW27045.1 nitrogenase [Alkalibaculum sporogenes]